MIPFLVLVAEIRLYHFSPFPFLSNLQVSLTFDSSKGSIKKVFGGDLSLAVLI